MNSRKLLRTTLVGLFDASINERGESTTNLQMNQAVEFEKQPVG